MTEILFMGDFEPAEFQRKEGRIARARRGISDRFRRGKNNRRPTMSDRVVGRTGVGRAVRGLGAAAAIGLGARALAGRRGMRRLPGSRPFPMLGSGGGSPRPGGGMPSAPSGGGLPMLPSGGMSLGNLSRQRRRVR